MKLISWNVNGFRACLGKGFEEFFKETDADFFCIHEHFLFYDFRSHGIFALKLNSDKNDQINLKNKNCHEHCDRGKSNKIFFPFAGIFYLCHKTILLRKNWNLSYFFTVIYIWKDVFSNPGIKKFEFWCIFFPTFLFFY